MNLFIYPDYKQNSSILYMDKSNMFYSWFEDKGDLWAIENYEHKKLIKIQL